MNLRCLTERQTDHIKKPAGVFRGFLPVFYVMCSSCYFRFVVRFFVVLPLFFVVFFFVVVFLLEAVDLVAAEEVADLAFCVEVDVAVVADGSL